MGNLIVRILCVACLTAGDEPSDLRLWYDSPAVQWTEALPIGNGRIGAMVFGGTAEDRYQLNEDSLWCGGPRDYAHEGAAQYLGRIRQLLFEGKQKEAQDLAGEHFMSIPLGQMPYQPFGDLTLTFPGHEKIEGYRRELDLDTAVATTTYRIDGVTYTRQAIASWPDQVIVVRIGCSRPGAIRFAATWTSPNQDIQIQACDGDTLAIRGRARDYKARGDFGIVPGQMRFEGRCRVEATGGRVSIDDKRITVEDASTATLTLALATSVKSYNDISADPGVACAAVLKKAASRTPRQILDAHVADHQALFRRVSLDLGPATEPNLPTDQRVLKYAQREDPQLAALFFQYGRYLMIASSRQGGQPANLQGLWNDSVAPPWDQVHDQHQHGDELLAHRADQPERVRPAVVRRAGGPWSDGPVRRGQALRRPRLGRAPQFRPLARSRSDQRLQPRHLAHRRRMAVPASLVALPLHRRQDLPGRAGVSADEGRIGVLRGVPRRGPPE